MRNTLIIDLTHFYGGGQKFVDNIFRYSSNTDKYHFIVSNEKLFFDLKTDNKCFLESGSGFIKTVRLINKYIADRQICTVILNGNRPIYFAPFITCNLIVAYRHTSNNAFRGMKKNIGGILLNTAFLWCNKIVVLYQDAIKEIWQKEKVAVINNGIAVPKMNAAEKADIGKTIVICCISRLDADKGIDWLIKVFIKTFKGNSNVVLKIAGDGDMREKLAAEINRSGAKIELLGFVTDIDSLLDTSDLFILPSKFESFPLSILEAMGHSLPIIATHTGGTPEMVINGENGFLIEFGDDKALEEKMGIITYERSTLRVMGACSYKMMSNFSIENCVNKLEELIK